ncbi:dioxygenase family protein [Nocardioides nitrophenolicus]|uniref:dioxygenase family protein n=1 Tax=Nocardioides nitrophenolicus TaxID=60489 RepID=UPI00195B9680|nr:3,4-dioxygenase subunit beta [Nocardioides nitrophenolicus]MBM7519729.1 protocatechuate 3,4-dioxygenase beta subunit [Nocardioides nitrophenolicus]
MTHDHDLGLRHDLPRILRTGRRGLLGVVGGAGALALAGCATDGEPAAGSPTSTPPTAPPTTPSPASPPPSPTDTVSEHPVDPKAGEIPEETEGPFPADGSNGPDVLTEAGVVRRDIRASFGSASGVAQGVPVTLRMRIFDLAGSEVTPLAGAAVYAWQCDREGRYSLYNDGARDENYLRGVQEADAEGGLEFLTVFPGCYPQRWPHIHFEVYESLAAATRGAAPKLRTSQLAFPARVAEEVYASTGYGASVPNFRAISLDSDSIFRDGYSLQMVTMTGSVADGYVATLNVPV